MSSKLKPWANERRKKGAMKHFKRHQKRLENRPKSDYTPPEPDEIPTRPNLEEL